MNSNTEQRRAEAMKTMRILDELPRIEPHHLFRARLLERIESENAGASVVSGLNPRLAFFSLLLAINIAMGTVLLLDRDTRPSMQGGDAIAESYGDEYGSPALSYYDQQEEEPANRQAN
jgi:hypothetical protein